MLNKKVGPIHTNGLWILMCFKPFRNHFFFYSRNTPRYFRKISPLIAISVSNTRCRCYPKSPILINCNFSILPHESRCILCLFLSHRLFRVEQIAIRTASGKKHYAHNSQNSKVKLFLHIIHCLFI
jgi:hypothetical protein